MVSVCRWKEFWLSVSLKPGCLTISLENGPDVKVYSFDFAGRLWTSLEGGRSFRHGLEGRTLARWKNPQGRQMREWLSPSASNEVINRARLLAKEIIVAQREGNLELSPPLLSQELQLLTRAGEFDLSALNDDKREFHRLYRNIGILPPDQYMAVLLQLTEGCSFNTCTFCNFYKDQAFRIKTVGEFKRHAFEVRNLLREGISLRKTIFMGSANALVLPLEKIKPYFDVIHQVYDVQALGGIYAFLDGFSGERKSEAEFRELAGMGLDTVYVGMESGSDDLLAFLKKPSNAENTLKTVLAAKSAGVRVAVIVLLGVGGTVFAPGHVRQTTALLNKMSLDAGDIIYFSKLIDPENSIYAQDINDKALLPLSEAGQEDQWKMIEAGLKFDPAFGVPRISIYDVRDFVF